MDVWIRNSRYDFDRLLDHLVGKTGLKACEQHVSACHRPAENQLVKALPKGTKRLAAEEPLPFTGHDEATSFPPATGL